MDPRYRLGAGGGVPNSICLAFPIAGTWNNYWNSRGHPPLPRLRDKYVLLRYNRTFQRRTPHVSRGRFPCITEVEINPLITPTTLDNTINTSNPFHPVSSTWWQWKLSDAKRDDHLRETNEAGKSSRYVRSHQPSTHSLSEVVSLEAKGFAKEANCMNTSFTVSYRQYSIQLATCCTK